MILTQDQQIKLRLLSDGELYEQAVIFIRENGTIKNAQISGLENIVEVAGKFSDIIKFTKHQSDKKKDYSDFYKKLTQQIESIKIKLDEYGFIPEGLIKVQSKEYTEFYGLLVVREFIYHLSAEHRYQQKEP